MKKISIILLFLISIPQAFAGTKSARVEADMVIPDNCQYVAEVLNHMSDFNKKINTIAQCNGSVVTANISVSYWMKPSQSFSINFGSSTPRDKFRGARYCKAVLTFFKAVTSRTIAFEGDCYEGCGPYMDEDMHCDDVVSYKGNVTL